MLYPTRDAAFDRELLSLLVALEGPDVVPRALTELYRSESQRLTLT